MSERARAALALALCLGLCSTAAAQNTNTLTLRSTPSGGVPALAATGADVNISINLVPKGAGVILFNGGALPGTGTVTGSGTTAFLPRWTAPTALGDSLLYEDAANSNVFYVRPPHSAPAMASLIQAELSTPTFGVDSFLEISSVSAFGPELNLFQLRGSYSAPTKSLSGDLLGIINWFGYTGVHATQGPVIVTTALTDMDNVARAFRLDILGHSALDTVRLGVGATPELTVTNGLLTLTGTLNATVAYQANGTPGKTQAYVLCTGAACATSCTLTFTQGILTGNAGTCP